MLRPRDCQPERQETFGREGSVEPCSSIPRDKIASCQVDEGLTSNKFLFYYLLHQREALIAAGQGGAQPNLTNQIVREWPVLLPPLVEEERIVNKIDKLLAELDSTRTRLSKVPLFLKHFRQAVLAAACSGKLTQDWRKEHPAQTDASGFYRELLQKRRSLLAKERSHYRDPLLASDELLELPEGWLWVSVDSISTKVVDGVHHTPDYVAKGIPFVTVRNLTAGPGLSFDSIKYISEKDHETFIQRARPEQGDILVSKDGTLGVIRAVRTDRVFSIFVSVALIKPVLNSMTDYLELALSSPQVQEQMIGTGSGLQHIHLRDLRADCVPLPSVEEQQEIVRRVEALFKLADAIEKRVEAATLRAERLTQAILAKAFRGELVTTEAELARREGREYEPASVLLERIKRERERAAQKQPKRGKNKEFERRQG